MREDPGSDTDTKPASRRLDTARTLHERETQADDPGHAPLKPPTSLNTRASDAKSIPGRFQGSVRSFVKVMAGCGWPVPIPRSRQLVGDYLAANRTEGDTEWRKPTIGLGERSIRATCRRGRCQ
ncbi:hypothetical protein GCM10009548_70330 [Streptomyces malaysiensis subsp. malaysiensis]